MRRVASDDQGLLSVALAYVVLATTVVSIVLSWFLLGQAQAYATVQQDKNAAAIQEASTEFLYAINTDFNTAWLTDSSSALSSATASFGNDPIIGSTASITAFTQLDARTFVATITATSTKNASITLTKQITYRAVGVYAFGSTAANNGSLPTWDVDTPNYMLGLYEIANATQVSH